MKERLLGAALIAGTALALGVIWVDSAQAFSLGNTVTVENLLRDSTTSEEFSFQGPIDATVGPGQESELVQFGGIWNIDLGDDSISFMLNSRFGNVISGDDVYRFSAPNFGQPGQNRVTGFTITPFKSNLTFGKDPVITLLNGSWIDVVFLTGFAPENVPDLTQIPGQLGFKVNLIVEPTAVPTPALLPGLVGLGLAVLRKHREEN